MSTQDKTQDAPKFKVGDLVRIIGREYGHEFKIGDVVQVVTVHTEDDKSFSYTCEDTEMGFGWCIGEDECEPAIQRPQTYIATTSQLIQTIRRAHGWSQRELAELCEGLHQPNVSVLEKLDAPPTVELLSKLVKATGIGWGIAIQPSGAVQIFSESDFYDSAISAILEDAKTAVL